MFKQTLKFYRLKNRLTLKELADKAGITPQAVSNYEKGNRFPEASVAEKLASALGIRVADFLVAENDALVFSHGDFRKQSRCSKHTEELARETVEEYCRRFFIAVDAVGEEVLPPPPKSGILKLSNSREIDAANLRRHLGVAPTGAVPALIDILENKGIIVILADIADRHFSGINGFVNGRPYIMINMNATPERTRSNAMHEISHLMFDWGGIEQKKCENFATSIGGAFLFPEVDAKRELGLKRKSISKDMELVCKEYGISIYMLTMRAKICGIISDSAAQSAFKLFSMQGWKANEPVRIPPETPTLFKQLVYRAVSSDCISIQKGAELLRCSINEVADNCIFETRSDELYQ